MLSVPLYKQICFYECVAEKDRVRRMLFLGRAKALAIKGAEKYGPMP